MGLLENAKAEVAALTCMARNCQGKWGTLFLYLSHSKNMNKGNVFAVGENILPSDFEALLESNLYFEVLLCIL